MDISSPSSLWRDYDVSALPLNESELSCKTDGELRVREYYFDGLTTLDGRVRAFMRIFEQPSLDKGIIMYMPDAHTDAVKDDVVEGMLKRGYTVAVLDYTGKSEVEPRYTLYPASLSLCNCINNTEFVAVNEPINSRWYIWTCMARRALHLLNIKYESAKIFALGKALGASTVYKLAAFDDGPIACATLLNALPDVTGTGNLGITYRAALENFSYAPVSCKPIFMTVCSNSDDGMLDEMSELAQATVSLKSFRIIKRAGDDSISAAFDQLDNFFSYIASGKPTNVPHAEIKAVNSENKLYFHINLDDEQHSGEVNHTLKLYAAFCIKNPALRNWTKIKTERIGANEYLAHVEVLQNDMPVYTFIDLTDERGNVYSSPITVTIPKNLGITAVPTVKRRLIYDGGMGKDVWVSTKHGKIGIKSGPYGIDGISSENNSLITYKPGDLLYRADSDSLLQIMVSGKCNDLQITVSDGTELYTCTVQLTVPDEWNKFTLAPNTFKSTVGPLSDWSRVVMIKIVGDEEFIVSSALWV